MAHFILVHGACHGAWCWQKITPGLTALGHRVTALDMPGRGAPDGCDAMRLSDHADMILDAIGDEPAVLAGHSAGGFSISAAAERAPDRVRHLVYVAALLPRDGDTLMGKMGALKGARPEARFLRTENRQGYVFDTDGAGPLLYNGATEADMAWALPQVCAEPTAPHRDPIALGPSFAGVAKSYVLCGQDRIIPAEDQAGMAAGLAPERVHALDTGHSPFLSEPLALVDILHRTVDA